MIKENNFITKDNISLYFRYQDNHHDKWLIMTHGIGDHCSRYDRFFKEFSPFYNIIQWDLRGHGKSGGKRGYVDYFEEYTDDMYDLIQYLKNRFKIKSFTLFSHSMGALITSGLIQNKLKDNFYPEFVFLNAPPVSLGGPGDIVFQNIPTNLLKAVLKVPGSLPINTGFNFKFLSHDPNVQTEHSSNPLTVKKLHSRLLLEVARYSKEVYSKPLNLKTKGFVSYGTSDKIVSPEAIEKYFTREENFSVNKVIGAYHEIHLETPQYADEYFQLIKKCLQLI